MLKTSLAALWIGLIAMLAVPLARPARAVPAPSASIWVQGSTQHPRAHHRKGHSGRAHTKRRAHRRRNNA